MSFCIGLVTQLNVPAFGVLKHHYITKIIRELLIGNSRFLIYNLLNHSHKKRKDSLEGSLDRVLPVAELEFPKILVSMLPQHTSNVNNEYARKSEWSKQQSSLHVTSFLEH